MTDIFFFGSLRDAELLAVVLGHEVAPGRLVAARAPGRRALRLADEAYPVLVSDPSGQAEGVVLRGADEAELARLAFFEEAEYGLTPITVETPAGRIEAQHFRATGKAAETDAPWDFSAWQEHDRPVALEAARELMDHYGRWPVERIDDIWPGIMIRARQRARARAETPALGRIRTAFAPDDVETVERRQPYTGYMAVEERRLRHRRFDGGWTGEMERNVALFGDAVTVLPYDAARDRVLLIEQFRPGPAARGDPNPWCIEVVAGRLDGDDGPEATARREAEEEAGVTPGRLERIGTYYASSGLVAEQLVSFVAEADLAGAGGLHGLAGEHEDIRAFVTDLDTALSAAAEGAVNTGPALVSLLWLAANRARLRAEWTGRGG